MKYRWIIAGPLPELVAQLAAQLQVPELLARCLTNRGLESPASADAFLRPRLKNLADPFALPAMRQAVDRLLKARVQGERLVLFGDYDVDGVSSTALLEEFLSSLGWQVFSYLPNRMDEGYGLSREGVENCLRRNPATLLLAIDCGSATPDTVGWLQGKGVDVIVLDHHQVSNPAPAAVALVNPQVGPAGADGKPPFSELCSAGLAFKLAHALVKAGREQGLTGFGTYDLRPLVELAALGTIADLVPLTGESRILAAVGLLRLNTTSRTGLVALKRVASCPPQLSARDVAFQLAPRLNAAGRLETAEAALALLRAQSLEKGLGLARQLDGQNQERQQIEKEILHSALEKVERQFQPGSDMAVVAADPAWHLGVVGIVAARILQRFYRPTIILGGDGDLLRGSGRSIEGFDLAAALRECSELLERHGGHAMAAGVTLKPQNLEAFRQRFNEVARSAIQPGQLVVPLRLDGEVRLCDLTLDLMGILDQLKPEGQGNPPVQLFARDLNLVTSPMRMGAESQHVKLRVAQNGATLDAVWWEARDKPLPSGRFDLAFVPQRNEFNGRTTIQLRLLDWRPAA